jgi:hypothetical protein
MKRAPERGRLWTKTDFLNDPNAATVASRSGRSAQVARPKKTLSTFGAHRGGCEVSAIADSVAVGLNQAALADEIA